MLERVVKFVFENIGNTFSARKIYEYFKSQNRSISVETVYNYLDALVESYIISRVKRFDLKGKEILKTQEKFYACDQGFVMAWGGRQPQQISGLLENIVYNELLFRGYEINIGKLNGSEIDFIATKTDEVLYIQVAYLLESTPTLERELHPLQGVRSSHRKLLLTLDKYRIGSYEGIECIYIPDWLLGGDS
jgi:predicted AAA+ superfamily ATPase